MLNWERISAAAEHALTLDASALNAYLNTIEDAQEASQIKRLLQHVDRHTSFMATSITDTVIDQELLKPGEVIGAWKITEHLDRGGMGDVYKACRADGLYQQDVALKVMQGLTASRADLFEIERRRLALMDHPGIARIIDGGTSKSGSPYMVMEYVNGMTLNDYITQSELGLETKLSLFLSVCSAVEHAHGKLVLHRDIKSQNVLVDAEKSTRLIDFGISSEVDDQNSVGAFSLPTAAPEQLKNEMVSVQTDVFALGILLYEMTTGKSPSRNENGGMRIDRSVIADNDLCAIVEKAMSFAPENRYSSTSSLSDDVKAFLSCEPVSAANGGLGYRAAKFIRRYPYASTFALIAILSLGGGFAASLNFANDASIEAKRANEALVEAKESLARAEFFLERSDIFSATQSAYADTLQSLFGAEADVDKQTRVLKERWQQTYELRGEDPENAAYLSYAIGRHFLFRNDYSTAISILEPWILEGYGPDYLLGLSTQLLAIAYFSVGREADALLLLRRTEKWFAESYEAGTPDHIAAATQIAILTEDKTDIQHAEELLLEGLKGEPFDAIRTYFWNQTAKLRELRGDFNGAYDAMKEAVGIIESKPLMERSGGDTALLSLANFELWHTQDLSKAKQLADTVISFARDTKGESRELGIAYAVLAHYQLGQNNYDEALKHAEQSSDLVVKYAGADSNAAIYVNVLNAEILSLLKDAEATNLIQTVWQSVNDAEKPPRVFERVKLADVFIVRQLQGLNEANVRFEELQPDSTVIGTSMELTYKLNRLKDIGLITSYQ